MARIDSGRGGLWVKKRFQIPAASSVVIHTIALTAFHTVDYKTSVFNDAQTKNKTLDIKAHNDVSTIRKSVYNKIGNVSISFVFSISSGNMLLTATNNEAFILTLEYARLVQGA